jgi:alkanesulfonate monooxygenase SsuD/methylene tetrahydromethanopterin reductase-like flavin-dependent oxidoreductase (luciferase family)
VGCDRRDLAGLPAPDRYAVTAPTVRLHPAVVAQAAATAAVQLEGRFTLGIGTGEALNEHILGDAWPSEPVRLDMLEEAVKVMRALWSGGFTYRDFFPLCRDEVLPRMRR